VRAFEDALDGAPTDRAEATAVAGLGALDALDAPDAVGVPEATAGVPGDVAAPQPARSTIANPAARRMGSPLGRWLAADGGEESRWFLP
jgi:hypothetical protein